MERFRFDLLGMPIGVSRQKRWLTEALAVAGVAGSLLGGAQASKAAKRAERRQRQREAEDAAWYARRYNEDYIDTAAGQNLVRRAKEYAKEQWRKAAGAQAVAGGTDAATQAAKDAGNKMLGDTIANIAATDQQMKQRIDDQYNRSRQHYAEMDMNRDLNAAKNITDASQNFSNAMFKSATSLVGEENS